MSNLMVVFPSLNFSSISPSKFFFSFRISFSWLSALLRRFSLPMRTFTALVCSFVLSIDSFVASLTFLNCLTTELIVFAKRYSATINQLFLNAFFMLFPAEVAAFPSLPNCIDNIIDIIFNEFASFNATFCVVANKDNALLEARRRTRYKP